MKKFSNYELNESLNLLWELKNKIDSYSHVNKTVENIKKSIDKKIELFNKELNKRESLNN